MGDGVHDDAPRRIPSSDSANANFRLRLDPDPATVTVWWPGRDYMSDPPAEVQVGLPPFDAETGAPNPPFLSQAQTWASAFSPLRGLPRSPANPHPRLRWFPTLDFDYNASLQLAGGSGHSESLTNLISARLALPQFTFADGRWIFSSQIGVLGSSGPQFAPPATLLAAGATAAAGVSSAHQAYGLFAQFVRSGTVAGTPPASSVGMASMPSGSATATTLTGIAQAMPGQNDTLIANPTFGIGSGGSFLNTQPYGGYRLLGLTLGWQHVLARDDAARTQTAFSLEGGYGHWWVDPLASGDPTEEHRLFIGPGIARTEGNLVYGLNADVYLGVPAGGASNPLGWGVGVTGTVAWRIPLFTPQEPPR